jgi:hypothetical protein
MTFWLAIAGGREETRERERIGGTQMTMKPKTRKAADPIFAAIAEHKAISKELWGRLYDALDEAEGEARKTHGMRPSCERSGDEWDQRAGIAPLREQYERANHAEIRLAMRMARTKPTTPAGAAALIAYVVRDLEDVALEDWHSAALKTVAVCLAQMTREVA